MFKQNKTVSLDVSLISPAMGAKGRLRDMYQSGGPIDASIGCLSSGRRRRISGTRSPMRLSLTRSNVDLRSW